MDDEATNKENNSERIIQLEYNYDRLIDMKIIQAYQLLVPDKAWIKDSEKQSSMKSGENSEDATIRDICKSFFGSAKRRTYY